MNKTNISHQYQPTCKRCTISVDEQKYLRLRDYGKFGETFKDLISRILNQLENNGDKSVT